MACNNSMSILKFDFHITITLNDDIHTCRLNTACNLFRFRLAQLAFSFTTQNIYVKFSLSYEVNGS